MSQEQREGRELSVPITIRHSSTHQVLETTARQNGSEHKAASAPLRRKPGSTPGKASCIAPFRRVVAVALIQDMRNSGREGLRVFGRNKYPDLIIYNIFRSATPRRHDGRTAR